MKALDIRINDRYRVGHKIGGGGYGVVYSGTDLDTGEEIAIKLEHIRENMPMLDDEASVYKALSGGPADFSYEHIHHKSFVHRDIKPENILMGTGKLGNVVYVVDFGLAWEYQDPETKIHMAYCDKHVLGGTTRYASVNNHLGIEQSRRDDLESLGYTMIYLVNGFLPWQGLKAATDDQKNELIKEKKLSTSIEDLCGDLPKEFSIYLKYVRDLGFEDQPDYSYLRKIFRRLFVRKGFRYDNVFDWTIKQFFMIHDNVDQPAVPSKLKRDER